MNQKGVRKHSRSAGLCQLLAAAAVLVARTLQPDEVTCNTVFGVHNMRGGVGCKAVPGSMSPSVVRLF